MSVPEEQILVVPRSVFEEIGAFQGLGRNPDRYLAALLAPPHPHFVPRGPAEKDPSLKQLIPYAVMTCQGRILRYFRGGSSGEARLRAKGSIGIGGHINDGDLVGTVMDAAAYRVAVDREIGEELHQSGSWEELIVGLLNDDSNEVGQVHLGVIHHCRLSSPEVHPGENALTGLAWLTLEELRAEREGLETWSQIIVDHWEELISRW